MAVTVSTRAEHTAYVLRQAIQLGHYLSGERLTELKLADQLEVSQNTVREALRLLEAEGWVVKHARRGVFVRSFNAQEVRELCSLRIAVGGLALAWIMEMLSKGELESLSKLINQAEQHARTAARQAAVESLLVFHDTIARYAKREQTRALLQRLHNQARLLEALRQRYVPHTSQTLSALIDAHRTLLAAMQAGNSKAAQQALHDCINQDCDLIIQAVFNKPYLSND